VLDAPLDETGAADQANLRAVNTLQEIAREVLDGEFPRAGRLDLSRKHRTSSTGRVLPPLRDFLLVYWRDSTEAAAKAFCDGNDLHVLRDVFKALLPQVHALANAEARDREQGVPLVTELGDRVMYPRTALTGFSGEARLSKTLERLAQKDLFPSDENTELVLREAVENVKYNGRVLRDLSAGEARAMHGALSIFSSGGDDGQYFKRDQARVPWGFWKRDACKLTNESAKVGRKAMTDLLRLRKREIPMLLTFKGEEGQTVLGSWSKLVEVMLVFENEADGIKWMNHNPSRPWTGAQPKEVVLKLPELMRPVFKGLPLTADYLERLEEGSRKAGGKGRGIHAADHALFMEVCQTRQAGQKAADGSPRAWSYINREVYLTEMNGEAKLKKRRGEIEARYLLSLKALKAGGLIERYELEHEGRNGLRDRVLIAEDVVYQKDPNQLEVLQAAGA
jgi:hypothetical protein